MPAAAEPWRLAAAEITSQCSRRLPKATLRSLPAAAAALPLAATSQALRPSPTLALQVSRQPSLACCNVSLLLSSRDTCSTCCAEPSSTEWDDTQRCQYTRLAHTHVLVAPSCGARNFCPLSWQCLLCLNHYRFCCKLFDVQFSI